MGADAEAHPPHPATVEVHDTPMQVSHPLCNSVPVKTCENIPTHTPRRVARTLCAVHTDITTIEDCTEIITTKCSRTSQSVAHASNVVGHDTRVGPPAVVAVDDYVAHHPVVAHAPVAHHPVVAHDPVAHHPVVAQTHV